MRRGRCLTEAGHTGNAFVEVDSMRDHRALPPAIVASLLVHVALFAAVRITPATAAPHAPAPASLQDPVDVWAGTTAELPGAGERMYEVEVAERAAPASPAPAAQAAPASAPMAAPPTPVEPAAPPQPSTPPRAQTNPPPPRPAATAPAPATAATAPATATAPARAPATAPASEDPYADPPARAERPSPPTSRPGRGTPAASAAPGSSAEARAPGEPGQGAPGGAQGSFGAEGSASVRSLGRAFTRAIPPACQADAGWGALPAGSAGTARVVIEIDAEGHVAGWKPEKGSVPPHFESLVKRTLALLRSGTFAVQGSTVSAGAQVIEISATLGEATAAAEGSAMDLAWRFEDGRGTASFTQASGRRVEVTLRVVKAMTAGAGLAD
jgi:outer membrane biosynthesis protein TonB